MTFFRTYPAPRRHVGEDPRVVFHHWWRHEGQVRVSLRRHAGCRERVLGPGQRTCLALVDYRNLTSWSTSPSMFPFRQYSGDLYSGLVCYLLGWKLSDCQICLVFKYHLKTRLNLDQYSDHRLKAGPFYNQTCLDHLNTSNTDLFIVNAPYPSNVGLVGPLWKFDHSESGKTVFLIVTKGRRH